MRPAPHANNTRARLSDDLIRELYIDQGFTLAEVARRLGVAPTTVSRKLRDLAIPARARGPVPLASRSDSPMTSWNADLAWVVGLIATDGNLSSRRPARSITSKDVDLLDSVRARLHLSAAISRNSGGWGHTFRLQWTDRALYQWLRKIGLTPAKTLTIGALDVPDRYFVDFFRGCIDGDGSIVTYVDRYNTSKNAAYVYDRVYVSLVSASLCFLEWIRSPLARLREVSGDLTVRRERNKHDIWRLRYAKRESVTLLRWMY